MIPDHTTIQVRISGKGQAGIGRFSWKGLTRYATRRLRFVVHAAGWLHSMVLHRRMQTIVQNLGSPYLVGVIHKIPLIATCKRVVKTKVSVSK